MGEYWKPVNLTKREWIHPHHVGCGLKLAEWRGYNSPVEQLMRAKWEPSDQVVALSDYGGLLVLQGETPDECISYDDVEDVFTEIK